jgi:hypothetical protein
LVRVATDFYVRTVAVKCLDPVRHSRTVVVRVVPVAAARAFVWSWSHDTCLIAVDIIGPLSGRSIPLAPSRSVLRGYRRQVATPSPEPGQPRRDRRPFQPFSVFSCPTMHDARRHIGRYPQDPYR